MPRPGAQVMKATRENELASAGRFALGYFRAGGFLSWLAPRPGMRISSKPSVSSENSTPQAKGFLPPSKTKYGVKGPEDVFAPVGVANAYDALNLLALAIEQAGSDGCR